MTCYATLTFDLDKGVTTSQRAKFYAELKKHNFAPHKLTTLWTATFRSNVTQEQAKSFTRKIVDDAAAFAGITVYEALLAIGDEPPMEWGRNGLPAASEALAAALRRYQA